MSFLLVLITAIYARETKMSSGSFGKSPMQNLQGLNAETAVSLGKQKVN
jgi:hypothetical protein